MAAMVSTVSNLPNFCHQRCVALFEVLRILKATHQLNLPSGKYLRFFPTELLFGFTKTRCSTSRNPPFEVITGIRRYFRLIVSNIRILLCEFNKVNALLQIGVSNITCYKEIHTSSPIRINSPTFFQLTNDSIRT